MLDRFLHTLRSDPAHADRVAATRVDPPRAARYGSWPEGAAPELLEVLARRGIERPYTHQAAASESVLAGQHTVVVTPTASGKSLCYNLPILSSILAAGGVGAAAGGDGVASDRPTALYLFPTKALSQDQVAELNELVKGVGDGSHGIGAWTYDGDTPGDLRTILREKGDVIVTNPYMLHVAVLPNHLRWHRFFRRLKYVVIDELHVYTGIFGSSVANVMRRLRRIARHYGSDPVFVAASATIPNPGSHFERLLEVRPTVIDDNGAPSSERHHVLYNPPLTNPALGLRERAVDTARGLAKELLRQRVPSIVFGRSRTTVEVLTKYLKDAALELGRDPAAVVAYRGGYLPNLRREIENGLRTGAISMVCATNALELGVDIGSLDAVVMCGYPGTVSSYHQQAGRAGRRSGTALALMVATSRPLDQYVLAHSEYVLEGHGGRAVVDPDNLVLATHHLKCGAFELPFHVGDAFGTFPHTGELLHVLAQPQGVLLEKAEKFHWMDQAYPAEEVSLDAVESDTFVVLEDQPADVSRGQSGAAGRARSLGHVDRPQALTTLHKGAIYQHQGVQYQIMELDWEGRRAYAKRVKVDWYTEAETETDIQVLQEDGEAASMLVVQGHGDVHVTTLATLFKRIRFYTNENVETGPIDLPAEEMDTTAWWLVIQPELERQVRFDTGTRSGAVGGLAHLLRGVAPLFVQMGGGALRARGYACHPHWERPVVLLYDGVPGGVGLAERLFSVREDLLAAALEVLRKCPCQGGCPSCIGLARDRGPAARRAAREILEALTQEPAPCV